MPCDMANPRTGKGVEGECLFGLRGATCGREKKFAGKRHDFSDQNSKRRGASKRVDEDIDRKKNGKIFPCIGERLIRIRARGALLSKKTIYAQTITVQGTKTPKKDS